jgi:hypothetical protein
VALALSFCLSTQRTVTALSPTRVSILCVNTSTRVTASSTLQPAAASPSRMASVIITAVLSTTITAVACIPRNRRIRRASSAASCSGVRKDAPPPCTPPP